MTATWADPTATWADWSTSWTGTAVDPANATSTPTVAGYATSTLTVAGAVNAEASTTVRVILGGAPFWGGSATTLNGTGYILINITFGSMPMSPTLSVANSSNDYYPVVPVVTVP